MIPYERLYGSLCDLVLNNPNTNVTNQFVKPLVAPSTSPIVEIPPETLAALFRRSAHPKKVSSYLSDFQTHHITGYLITNYINYDHLSSSFKHPSLSITYAHEPQTYTQDSKDPQWIKAMRDKLVALQANHTWTITDLPPGKIAIGCHWVYKIKHKLDDSIDHFKAKLIAKGFNQFEGLDFLDTISPIAKPIILSLLLTLTISNNCVIKQLDVKNAFLHGDLHEEIFMKLTFSFNATKPNQVYKLQRSLYGLKHVGCQWYAEVSQFPISNKYTCSSTDHSLFMKH